MFGGSILSLLAVAVHQNNLTPNSFPIREGRWFHVSQSIQSHEVLANPATSATFRKTNPVPCRTLAILGEC
jgi:hypothetical protein